MEALRGRFLRSARWIIDWRAREVGERERELSLHMPRACACVCRREAPVQRKRIWRGWKKSGTKDREKEKVFARRLLPSDPVSALFLFRNNNTMRKGDWWWKSCLINFTGCGVVKKGVIVVRVVLEIWRDLGERVYNNVFLCNSRNDLIVSVTGGFCYICN